MEFKPHDQDIIRLLAKLKDIHVEYPENMLVGRRQSYLRQMVETEAGLSGGNGIRTATNGPKHPGTPPTVGTLLEAALIVAIAAEAGVTAYFYRNKLADFVQTVAAGPRIEESTSAPVVPASPEVMDATPSPAITSTLPPTVLATSSPETAGTPTSTPVPALAGENNGSATPGVNSTSNGNNGNHYGQTPKPQRTKENSGKNDKPPKDDDKPPKDKPTKDKPPKKK